MIKTRDSRSRLIESREYEYGDAKLAADFVDPISCPEISEQLIENRQIQRSSITLSFEYMGMHLAGLAIWQVLPRKKELNVLNLAYYPCFANEVIELFIKEIRKRRSNLWSRVTLKVREDDLEHQLFLSDRMAGFYAVHHAPIITDYYGRGKNAIEMEILSELPVYPELPVRA